MSASDLLTLLRSELFDTAEPYLWSDHELLSYLDEAQSNFCRWGAGILTVFPAYARLTFAPGTNSVRRHSAVMDVREVYSPSYMTVAGNINPFAITEPGKPRFLLVDVDDDYFYLDRPTEDELVVQLSVTRKPVGILADGDDPEIKDEYRPTLLLWAKHRAFDKKDPETYDPQKSGEYEARFRAACRQAKMDKTQDNEPPRVVAYGGL